MFSPVPAIPEEAEELRNMQILEAYAPSSRLWTQAAGEGIGAKKYPAP